MLLLLFFFACLLSGPPVVTVFEPNPTNATENQATQFECYGSGLPLPRFSIKKLVPPPTLGVRFTEVSVKRESTVVRL